MLEFTALPSTINAGTTVRYTRSLSGYPADDGWALTVYLAGASIASAAGAAAGASFIVTFDAAATADLEPGVYRWVERVTKVGVGTYDAADGVLEVLPDIAAAEAGTAPTSSSPGAPGSQQSIEEYQLHIVRLALTGRLTADMESYQIAGRAVVRIPYRELREIEADLIRRVELQKNPGQFSVPVLVTFGRNP